MMLGVDGVNRSAKGTVLTRLSSNRSIQAIHDGLRFGNADADLRPSSGGFREDFLQRLIQTRDRKRFR
jgi:hypothetical protein